MEVHVIRLGQVKNAITTDI